MKTILVTTGGSTTDQAVFATALCAARPLAAHLEFFHVRITAGEAARFTPHADFAVGAALRDAIARLHGEEITRSAAALLHFRTFCKQEKIAIVDVPCASGRLSASWREETNGAESRLMLRARHNDLVVIARPTRANGMPADLLEILLVGCGRPILIAPAKAPDSVSGTVMVCWKETAEAARALAAALPLLAKAERVLFTAVVERGQPSGDMLADIARQMAWHGIRAEPQLLDNDGRPAAIQLAAQAAACRADLMVMGAYGRSRTRELIFGGCTQSALEWADVPVLLLH
ncbi:MAG: universal stress protein [Alphaproteobacteria bacterium]